MQNLSWNWTKSSSYPTANNGLNVFGTFVCGGGSTMGYKLAGYNHLGGVEIDKKMAALYEFNHNPQYLYVEDIRRFNQREDLPQELYSLDLLDGSPPCTTFSMCGLREEGWGKLKHFNEGQAKQTLDDLVFVWTSTVAKLRPKVAVMENVPGLLAGRAKGYAIGVYDQLNELGYKTQIFQLNAATMGVPQARERVFFIARQKGLNFKDLTLQFNEPPIPFGIIADKGSTSHKPFIPSIAARWPYVEYGDQNLKFADAKYRNLKTFNAFFSTTIAYDNEVMGTLTSGGHNVYWNESRLFNDTEYVRMSSFPSDYEFMGQNVRYVCGMSVPPLMTARIAGEVAKQWFGVQCL